MYIPKKQTLTTVVEQTFALLLPDSADSHREMIEIFCKNGFLVTSKKFSPSFDEATLESLVNGIYTQAQEHLKGSHGNGEGGASHHSTPIGRAGRSPPNYSPSPLYPSSSTPHVAPLNTTNTQRALEASTEMTEVTPQQIRTHLVKGGSTVALILSASVAVKAAQELCGSSANPSTCRREAPTSIRALYGVNLLKNAIFVASSSNQANQFIHKVFGYEILEGQNQPSIVGPRSGETKQQQLDPMALMRSTNISEGEGGGVNNGSLLFSPNMMNVQASPGGGMLDPSSATPMARSGIPDSGGMVTPYEQAQLFLEKQKITNQKEQLAFAEKLLRLREMDLLLREQELIRTMKEKEDVSRVLEKVVVPIQEYERAIGGGGEILIQRETSMQEADTAILINGGAEGGGMTLDDRASGSPVISLESPNGEQSGSAIVNTKQHNKARSGKMNTEKGGGAKALALAHHQTKRKLAAANIKEIVVIKDPSVVILNPSKLRPLFDFYASGDQGLISKSKFMLMYKYTPCLHNFGHVELLEKRAGGRYAAKAAPSFHFPFGGLDSNASAAGGSKNPQVSTTAMPDDCQEAEKLFEEFATHHALIRDSSSPRGIKLKRQQITATVPPALVSIVEEGGPTDGVGFHQPRHQEQSTTIGKPFHSVSSESFFGSPKVATCDKQNMSYEDFVALMMHLCKR